MVDEFLHREGIVGCERCGAPVPREEAYWSFVSPDGRAWEPYCPACERSQVASNLRDLTSILDPADEFSISDFTEFFDAWKERNADLLERSIDDDFLKEPLAEASHRVTQVREQIRLVEELEELQSVLDAEIGEVVIECREVFNEWVKRNASVLARAADNAGLQDLLRSTRVMVQDID